MGAVALFPKNILIICNSGRRKINIYFYSILFYSILFYSILFYSTLIYSILFYYILLYSILLYSNLFYSILFYSILFYSVLFYSILIYSILCICVPLEDVCDAMCCTGFPVVLNCFPHHAHHPALKSTLTILKGLSEIKFHHRLKF
jgi:hypothetical protein